MIQTVYLNDKNGGLTQVNTWGFQSIRLIDEKHVEVVSLDGTKDIRTLYLSSKGVGHFYLNDTRYKIYNALESIP